MLSSFTAYSKRLHVTFKHPLARSIFITTTGFAVSDVICQGIEYKYAAKDTHEGNSSSRRSFELDRIRTLKFGFIGLLFGPQFHYWVPFVAGLIPGRTSAVALKRVFIDQAVYGSWACCFVLVTKELIDGNGFAAGISNVRRHFLEVYKNSCCIFPPGQFINYLLIPPHYRILWLNAVGFCWRIILSYLVYGKAEDPMEDESKGISAS